MKANEQKLISPLKKMWMCVGLDGVCDHRTLHYYRKDSINVFLANSNTSWSEWMKWGWRCIKVDVDFKINLKT